MHPERLGYACAWGTRWCVCLQPVGGAAAVAAAAALGTDYGIWIHSGPGWRRKAADDGSAVEPGERRRRMKVKTGDCTGVRTTMWEGGCVALGRTTKGAGRRTPEGGCLEAHPVSASFPFSLIFFNAQERPEVTDIRRWREKSNRDSERIR